MKQMAPTIQWVSVKDARGGRDYWSLEPDGADLGAARIEMSQMAGVPGISILPDEQAGQESPVWIWVPMMQVVDMGFTLAEVEVEQRQPLLVPRPLPQQIN